MWAILERERSEVYPEDIQDLSAPYVLGHRIWLGPHAASHGLTVDAVIEDVIEVRPDEGQRRADPGAAYGLGDITEIQS